MSKPQLLEVWIASLLLVTVNCTEVWRVYQNNFLCCSFPTLSSAQEFVDMNQGNGNNYLIMKEEDCE